MQASQNDMQSQIEQRMRTMRTLWVALIMSIGMYYVFTVFVGQAANARPNSTVSLTLLAVGVLMIPVALVIKKKLLTQAVEQHRPQQVQQAHIVAWAVTEVAALLGMLDFFLTGNRYYFVLFIVSVCGQLLQYPRRQHVVDAFFTNPTL